MSRRTRLAERGWVSTFLRRLLAFCLLLPAASGLAALLPSAPAAQAAPQCTADGSVGLLVRIHNVRSAEGKVTVILYGGNPAEFLAKGKRLDRVRVSAQRGVVTACLQLRAPGTFALAVYHDEDGDGRMTRNFVGLPAEGYGFSRDAAAALGPPSFAEVAFEAKAGSNVLDVTMRY